MMVGMMTGTAAPQPRPFLDDRTLEREGKDAALRDFIAGMTDRYAVALFEQLYIPRPWVGPVPF